MSKLYNFNSVYPLVESFYAVEPNPQDFEDVALKAWNLIGNRHTRLYRYVANTQNKELELPCNVDEIESVHIPIVDAQYTSNRDFDATIESVAIEGYIEAWKYLESPFYTHGKLIKYKEGDNVLYFNRDYKNVMVVYHGIIVDDEEGLPLLSAKEQYAIAAYVAYVEMFKEALIKKDRNSLALAQTLYADWEKRCSNARTPEHLSQNDMDAILDVKYRWNRKSFGKSLTPMV